MAKKPRTDDDIVRDVSETLAWDTRISDNRIHVESRNGRVTLTGTVPLFSQRTAASEDAWRIKGVREVVNQLTVSPSALRRDQDIMNDVIKALERDNRVDTRGITVDVSGSVVRLTGAVRSMEQKRAALEDAWHTAGVVDVADELTVSPDKQRPDRDIEDDVRTSLTRDARLSDPDRINVSVVDGIVYLRGGVDSQVERQAAEEDARFAAGIRGVQNQLALVSD